ncbi:hypothetical protein P22_2380 [Propionispora sp. 2/2-37]|uniref:tRNA (adenosine(37)-N6)-threonylcarbamoyltransferase complex ATPase subunit type 1 TsaE n=1 Tax=Propionispora sp. 2/2-37 TaxID=1677858 RepID=UPI0006BB7207|nr:tRNA (adenosine(37)-N6)-threonylcarbamoyltransferase complex ATPase subunit type 1 TsaE [Propionispora sp. 2/2-37]CUH96290.1 hypothetical protein P22_2380 [Propionispora sp. 2/2-37]
MIICKTQSPEATFAFGKKLAGLLHSGDVLCLEGDLGAGKTLLVQGITAGLPAAGPVTSPTFTVMNVYEGRLPVYHFDIYRLEHPAELQDIGFDEYTGSHVEGIAVIEWPDKFPEYMPEENIWIILSAGENPDERVLSIQVHGKRYADYEEELRKIADSCH